MPGWLSFIATLIFGALGLKRPPAPKPEQKLGQAEATLSNTENAVVELQAAAAARAAADAQRVRNDPHAGDVVTDPDAPINNLPGEHFRD